MGSMIPYKRWRVEKENIAVGDICFLMTDTKVGSPGYRLCRVEAVFPDSNGVVRTVKVAMRPRDSRELLLPYKSKDLWLTDVSVQRLVMVLPFKEQGSKEDVPKEVNEMEVISHTSPTWPLLFNSVEAVQFLDLHLVISTPSDVPERQK